VKTTPTIYKDRRKGWRWRFKRKGRIVADSAEGYKRQYHCRAALKAIITGGFTEIV